MSVARDCHSMDSPVLLGWAAPEPQLLPGSPKHWGLESLLQNASAFAVCSGCQLSSNVALIPQTIIPAQEEGKLPLTKSDLINCL